jgi:hypothetical protein
MAKRDDEWERQRKALLEEKDRFRRTQWAIRDRLQSEYVWKETSSVISMIAHTAGKTVQETLGTDAQDSYEDYIHAVLFTDGTGVALEYSAETRGYSEMTPGSPARTEYYLLTKRTED